MVSFAVNCLKETGTAIIFCSFQQWAYYYEEFEKYGGVTEKCLLIIMKPSKVHCFFRTSRLKNVTQCAIVWHKTAKYYRELNNGSSIGPYPAWTNVIQGYLAPSNVKLLKNSETGVFFFFFFFT